MAENSPIFAKNSPISAENSPILAENSPILAEISPIFKREFAEFKRKQAVFKPIVAGFDQLYPGNRRNELTILRLTTEHVRSYWLVQTVIPIGDASRLMKIARAVARS